MFRFGRPLGAFSLIFVLAWWSNLASAQMKDQLAPTLSRAHRSLTFLSPRGHKSSSPGNFAEFDSIQTFDGSFLAQGIGASAKAQRRWFYTIAGRRPERGGTTALNAPIIPVSLDLLDYDGSVRVVNGHSLHYSVQPFVNAVLESPVFQPAEYTSSDVPTQFSDAVLRAEFYNAMQPDWHTLLLPAVKQERTLSVPRGSYYFALNPDGGCCAFVLVDIDAFSGRLFPSSPYDTSSPVGGAEHSGDITPKDISTFLFPNTFLYSDGNPNHCCVLGFHTYDFEPGEAENGFREKRYVLNFSSWISSGLFAPGFEDITALSHEITESLHDPFVGSDGIHGVTPWWLSQNGNCQNDFETGDVIEGLAEATVAITVRGKTYHPQNQALLPWFAFQSPSTALGGAYSYPNQSLLTSLSMPQAEGCRRQ